MFLQLHHVSTQNFPGICLWIIIIRNGTVSTKPDGSNKTNCKNTNKLWDRFLPVYLCKYVYRCMCACLSVCGSVCCSLGIFQVINVTSKISSSGWGSGKGVFEWNKCHTIKKEKEKTGYCQTCKRPVKGHQNLKDCPRNMDKRQSWDET